MLVVFGVKRCVWSLLCFDRDDTSELVEDPQLVQRMLGLLQDVLGGGQSLELGIEDCGVPYGLYQSRPVREIARCIVK